eukprot:TRINITY_DN838_c0_g1_i1.p1 TRINITY_DN838_c0_g1~~TRINITY_DN838_c0_g1_i1.p1  ORF type:complete len:241 (+),score=38.70 TRINITY_DN838_c0_g1_i1:131-853(+)
MNFTIFLIFFITYLINYIICSPIVAWNLKQTSFEEIINLENPNTDDFIINHFLKSKEDLVVTFITQKLSISDFDKWHHTSSSFNSSKFHYLLNANTITSSYNKIAARELAWKVNNETNSVSYNCHKRIPHAGHFIEDIRSKNLKSNKIVVCLSDRHDENDRLVETIDRRLKEHKYSAEIFVISASESLGTAEPVAYYTPPIVWTFTLFFVFFFFISWGISALNKVTTLKFWKKTENGEKK